MRNADVVFFMAFGAGWSPGTGNGVGPPQGADGELDSEIGSIFHGAGGGCVKSRSKSGASPAGGPAVLLKFEFPRPLVLRAPEAGIAAGLLKPAQAILALKVGGQG